MEDRAAKFSIVCSDQPRNGKTLVARLIADYHILCGRETAIMDLSPGTGGSRRYFPIRARKINPNKTIDQMVLFDHALSQPVHDCVLDLPSHLLGDFFQLMRNFGFSEAAHAQAVELVIYFVLDRATGSMTVAERIRQENIKDRFIIVWNEAFMPTIQEGLTLLQHLKKSGELVIPELPANIIKTIEDPGFSFLTFVNEGVPNMAGPTEDQLKGFLRHVFHQLDMIEEDSVHKGQAETTA